MLKSTVLTLSVISMLLGLTACAKYPVVSQGPAKSPSAHAPVPAPSR